MNTAFRKSFARDLRKIKDEDILAKVRAIVIQVEAAKKPSDVKNLKKLAGTASYYRIRVGEYRIGIVVEGGAVEFVRCLHRRDLYRFFP